MTETQETKIVGKVEGKKERKAKPDNFLFAHLDRVAEAQQGNDAIGTTQATEVVEEVTQPLEETTDGIAPPTEQVPDTGEFAQGTEDQAVEAPADLTGTPQEQPPAALVETNALTARNGTDAQHRPTVEEMVIYCAHMISTLLIKGFEAIGAYLLTYVFGGNYLKALSKDPYKGTSLNDIARHPRMPLSRQRLAECIRAAAVTQELTASGVAADSLTFYHKVDISKLRSQDARLKIAEKVIAEKLTVRETTDCVRQLMGRPTSQDKRLAQGIVKQMRNLTGLAVSEDVREFLTDKERLRAALTTGETATLLDHSEQFRKRIGESQELLQSLEKTLVEIVVEARQVNQPGTAPEGGQE